VKARAKNGLINWLTIHGMIRTCVDLEKVNWPRVAKFNLPWDFDQVPNIGKKTAKEIEIYLATKGIFPQAKFCEWCGRKFSDLGRISYFCVSKAVLCVR
jgi:hypothetical protein